MAARGKKALEGNKNLIHGLGSGSTVPSDFLAGAVSDRA
jgi:hypothetical protein